MVTILIILLLDQECIFLEATEPNFRVLFTVRFKVYDGTNLVNIQFVGPCENRFIDNN